MRLELILLAKLLFERSASTNFATFATPKSIKNLVREKGLEPSRIYPQRPQHCASTNFATLALKLIQLSAFLVCYHAKSLSSLAELTLPASPNLTQLISSDETTGSTSFGHHNQHFPVSCNGSAYPMSGLAFVRSLFITKRQPAADKLKAIAMLRGYSLKDGCL